jgi:PEP-CTERM motif
MRQKHSGGRRMASTVGAAAAAVGGGNVADAAVVAQAVDVIIPPNYAVDLDGDAVKEFDLIDLGDPGDAEQIVKVQNFADGVGVVMGGEGNLFTANLAEGTLIGPGSLFSGPADSASMNNGLPPDDALNGFDGTGPAGEFQVEDGPGFIGVQFRIAEATHYGYVGFEGVELDPSEGPEGRVFALGYEDAPGVAIAAGSGLPEPSDADFDGDGDVDGRDLLVFQRGLGLTGQTDNTSGDADGSGTVDDADLDAFRAAFGTGAASGAAASAIPEPSSLGLLAAGAAGIIGYRRRNVGRAPDKSQP